MQPYSTTYGTVAYRHIGYSSETRCSLDAAKIRLDSFISTFLSWCSVYIPSEDINICSFVLLIFDTLGPSLLSDLGHRPVYASLRLSEIFCIPFCDLNIFNV